MHGTYPLPEAQLDRFLLKLRFDFPSEPELLAIMAEEHEVIQVRAVANAAQLLGMNLLARNVPAATSVLSHIAALIFALQPRREASEMVRDYVRLGPGPRGAQALTMASRVHALLDGRHNIALEDVRAVALAALRHRIRLNFDAERAAVTPEMVIQASLDRLPG